MKPRIGRMTLATALLAVAIFCANAPVASAATFVVDRTDDTNVIAAQACTAAVNDCSLRGAISKANATAGNDVITFDASTNGTPFTLTLANAGGANEDTNATGDLDVLSSGGGLTITGNGSSNTIIQAGTNATNGIDKVFAFNPLCNNAAAFSVSGVTIRYGRNTQTFGAADFSYTGGGLDFCGKGETGSSFSISNSIVTQNTNSDGYGGGMNIDEAAPAASVVTIANTQFTNNTSKYWGGGLNIFGDNGNVTITGSTFSNNQTLGTGGVGAQGGGINIRITNQVDVGFTNPTPFVNIDTSTVANNQAVGFGGGIDMQGSGNQNVTIANTSITGNSLTVVPGGVTNTTGGGIEHNNNAARTTTLTNVLIANNTSAGSADSHGGGIAHGAGVLIVRNSTISGNSAKQDGGGIYMTTDPTLTLINTTISNNRADSDNNSSGSGGAINKLAGAGVLTLQNTLVDGNFKGTGSTVNEIAGTVTANFSLVGNTTGATLAGGSANNQTNVSGRLAALANSGGQTVGPAGFTAVLQTHALNAGSPALDSGSNALVPGALTTDQRGTGFTRILDAADANTTDTVDIGAYEAHPSVEDLGDQAINEDGSLSTSFYVGDTDFTSGINNISVTSSNTTLVPNTNINVGGTGTNSISNSTNGNQSLVITPAANQFGATTITITANDTVNGTSQSMTDTFVLTVNAVADPPSISVATTDEDVQTSSGLVVTRNAVDGAEVTHFKITAITNGTLFKNNGTTQINNNAFITFAEANAGLKFTPVANLFSPGTTFSFAVAGATSAGGAGLGSATTASITVNPVADTPSISAATTNEDVQTSSGLVVTRNAVDGAEVTHFKITSITNGTLFKNNGTTAINNNDFITFAEANAGLKFTPAANLFNPGTTFSFAVAGATSAGGAGLGSATTASITVNPVADPPSISAATTDEDVQTSSGLVVTRNAVDGAEVTHFKITSITNGTLFKNDGTTQINNNAFITFAEANAGLKFTPAANLFSPGTTFSFDVAGATSAGGAGLGSATTASITVNPVADTPSISVATTDEDVQTSSGLVVTRNAVDGAEVTHFKITAITNGTLFKNNGTTAINNNDFITFAEANAGLKFTPAANLFSPGTTFSFAVAGATSAGGAGLGSATTASITVNPVADTPSVTNASTFANVQTSSGLAISRNTSDGSEVTHFKITSITGGSLFQNDGTTPIVNNEFITFAQGNVGLKFTPTLNSTTTGHFTAQASRSDLDAGLGGSTVTADITVMALIDALISKSVSSSSGVPNAAITYTLAFSNNGPGVAYGIVINDSIPVSVTITSVTSSTVGSGVVINQTSGAPNFTWAVSDLAVGAGGVITLTGTIGANAALIGAMITNTATITASNEITPTNNSDGAALTVTPAACYATPNSGTTVFASSDAHAVQLAVDAASPGGTVKVAGTCVGVELVALTLQSTYISKTLTLRGGYTNTLASWASAGDPIANPTTLNADQGGRVLFITGAVNVAVQNLRLTGGNAMGSGGGIYNSATTTISNTRLYSNTATGSGGGLFNGATGAATFIASTVVSNTANSNGGGVMNFGGALTLANGTLVQGNLAIEGGGVFNRSAGRVTIDASTLATNTASVNGGGVANYHLSSMITLTNGSLMRANRAGNGGGFVNFGGGVVIIQASTVASNTASNAGGGGYQLASVLRISNGSSMQDNTALNGGGIYNGDGVSVTLVTIDASAIASNTAANNGGGILNFGSGSSITLTNGSRLQGNSATTVHGGGIANNAGRVTIAASTIAANSSNTTGGGINNAGAGAVAIDGSTIDGNSAVTNGGGIFNAGSGSAVTVTNSSLLQNEAANGGALHQAGGVSRITASCIVYNNDTAVNYASGVSPLTATGNWWGAADGPSGAGPGSGDSASANVNFGGFLGAPILGCPNPPADLAVSKTVTPTTAAPGEVITYTLRFTNPGPNAAGGVVISDSLPVSVSLVSTASSGATITQTSGPPDLAWDVEPLSPGEGGVITITVTISPNAALIGTTITNTALITASNDITPTNNSDPAALTVTPAACYATPNNGATVFASSDAHAVQQAVNVAPSGGHVKVAGECVGVELVALTLQSTYISKTLTLSGGYTTTNWTTSHPITQPTVIDANSGGRVLFATVALTVSNITLQRGNIGGSGTLCPGAGCGGGVWAQGALTLSNVQVLSNTANSFGGGAYASGAATVANSRFENNHAEGPGGGLAINSTLLVTNTHFLSNTAYGAGGGAIASGAVTAANSRFENNRSTGNDGGGLYTFSTLLLTNTHFISNTASSFGGGARAVGAVTAANSRFENNRSTGNAGGGLYADSTLWLTNTHFISNTARGDGGGVYAYGAVTAANCRFENNRSTDSAGGGLTAVSTLWLTNTHFISNTAFIGGGAIAAGPAMAVNSRFENNRSTGSDGGGGLYALFTLVLTNTHFISNTASGIGGGARAGGAVTAVNSRFENNRSTTSGGGLYARSTLLLTNTLFLRNRAGGSGGGLYLFGTGTATGRLVNVLLAGNRADGTGNAIYANHDGGNDALTILHTTIASPTLAGGAAVIVNAGTAFITDTIVTSHTVGVQHNGGTMTQDYNLFYGNGANTAGTVSGGANSVSGDSAFVDPAADDYRLTATSAAINIGQNVGVNKDFEGDVRPGGGGFDAGYDETAFTSDVGIAKTATPTSTSPGGVVVYRLTFSNTGTGLVSNVVISDRIPVSVTVTGVTSATNGAGIVIAQTSPAPNLRWLVNKLAIGEGSVITITGVVSTNNALIDTSFTNTALIRVTADFTPTNNSGSAAVNVVGLPGTIIVQKVVVGTPPISAWQFVGPTGAFTLPAVGGSAVFTPLAVGPYTISETPQAGYTANSACSNGASGAASVNVTLGSAQTITCTFTNTRQFVDIVIVKQSVPQSSTNFRFTGSYLGGGSGSDSGSSIADFYLDDAAPDDGDAYGSSKRFTVPRGAVYSFSEPAVSGWYLSTITCTPPGSATVNLATRSVTIDTGSGYDVTCTFRNEKAAALTVRKYRESNGVSGQQAPEAFLSTWTIQVKTPSPTNTLVSQAATNALGKVSFSLKPGSYQVCEVMKSGWTQKVPNPAVNAATH
jgi:uncharacterized repeat protein (TIGR01451 family)